MRKLKRLLCGLLAMALLAGALPAAHAAGGNVQIGGSALSEGKNSIGGGTATLNTAAGTLVLGYGSLPDADCAAAGERLKKLCTAAREASDTV